MLERAFPGGRGRRCKGDRVKIALGQINPTIGGFQGNAARILEYVAEASRRGAELVVFPELAVCGYPPMDLLDHASFVETSLKALRRIQQSAPPGIGVVLGYVDRNQSQSGRPLVNAVSVIQDGRILFTQTKSLLPTYDVFDEARYFEPAPQRRVFPYKGQRLGIAICEDIWWESERTGSVRYPVDPVHELLDRGATLIVAPSASPFYAGKAQIRLRLLSSIGKSSGVPVVYVNMVGGNDSLLFDGRSMVTSPAGELVHLAAGFEERLEMVDLERLPGEIPLPEDRYADLEQALVLGIRDYLAKNRFQHVHLGLSGGIDSSLVAALATRALGREGVTVFALPSRYSSPSSSRDASALASNLGLRLESVPIEQVFSAALGTLQPVFSGREEDITEENLQARIRGMLLMAYSNKFHSLLLATGNKSELATGYCTLYGDLCGGLAPIGDLFKTEVYALARRLNQAGEVIPAAVLSKAPSAELKPNQTDQDTLPPYELLDQILDLYVLGSKTSEEIVARGYEPQLVSHVLSMVGRAEYKRRQAPPVLKVSPRAFGTGRRIPVARVIYED